MRNVCWILFLTTTCLAQLPQQQLAEKWVAANKLFREAKTQEDYQKVAAYFEAIAHNNVENGYLFFNLGNAYLKMDQLGLAIYNYRRANLHIPEYSDLQKNLQYARSLVDQKITFAQLPQQNSTSRTLFFWHFLLSRNSKNLIFVVCYVVFWGILLLRLWRPSFPFWIIASFSLIVCIAIGGSLLYEDYTLKNRSPGVLVGDNIEIRKGNADSYGQLYAEKTIEGGVEVYIIENRDDWVRVEMPDGLNGWVRSKNVKKVGSST